MLFSRSNCFTGISLQFSRVKRSFLFFFFSQNKSLAGDSSIAGAGGVCRNSSSNSWLKSRTSPTSRTGSGSSAADMNVQLGSAGSPTLRLASVKVSSHLLFPRVYIFSLNGFFNETSHVISRRLFATLCSRAGLENRNVVEQIERRRIGPSRELNNE